MMLLLIATSGALYAQQPVRSEFVGRSLYELVVNEQDGHVYAAATGTFNVADGKAYIYKLHPTTLAKLDSIHLPEFLAFGLAINNKTQTLYSSNTLGNSVGIIDLKTGKVSAVENGRKAHTRELVVDEERNLVYVSDVADTSCIWVIDGKSGTLQTLIENTGKHTTGLALDTKNRKLYYTNLGSDEVGVVDLKSNTIAGKFPSGAKGPINLAFDAAGKRLFVAHNSGTVSVLEAHSGRLLDTIALGGFPLGIQFDGKRNRVYVANRVAGKTQAIDARTYAVIGEWSTGTYPNTVAIHHATGRVYVSNKTKEIRPTAENPDPAPDTNGDTVSLLEP